MSDLSTPPIKKALIVATQTVRGKPGTRFEGLPDLTLAHRDARNLRDKLKSLHGYQPDNIVLMIDEKKHPEHLWPTRHNIFIQLKILTKNAPENCHIFFYFSGHCLEEEGCPARARMRADGLDSEIVCADGKPILDYVLHKRLVEPLEKVKGSKLFTLFDCCHSETLLDLQRGNRPNRYSRAWTIGAGQLFKGQPSKSSKRSRCYDLSNSPPTRKDVAITIANLLKSRKKYAKKRSSIPQPTRRASTMVSPSTSSTLEIGELRVICMSACRDQQLAHDDTKLGDTFTKCFIDATSKPNVTWEGLRDELKERISDIRVRYEESLLASSVGGESVVHWTQDPRLITSPCTDLRQAISF